MILNINGNRTFWKNYGQNVLFVFIKALSTMYLPLVENSAFWTN